jgi:transposase/predicted transcriptional regulator with HTH domain
MVAMKSERIGRLRIISERDRYDRIIKHVFMDYIEVARFYQDEINERRLAAVELVERGICNQKIAGRICGFHRNTVFKLLRAKRLLGVEAIFEDNRGPKGPYKYVNEIRSHVKKLLRKFPDWKDQDIADQAAKDLTIEVSRSAVARIRTEKQDKKTLQDFPSREELKKLAAAADKIDRKKFDDRQLEFNFTWDKEIKEKSEECSKDEPPKSGKQSDERFIQRMQQGQRFNFCGAMMHHLFLKEIGLGSIASVFPINPEVTYQSVDILSTLFHSINLGVKSIEGLKLVNAGELGILMGMNRAPEKETVREHLSQMATQYLSNSLIDRFAEALLDRGFIDPEVFFIDGHFLPYYGLKVIAKGYFTVRRLAMRGNELYAITDLQGRPLFFITESNEIDFRPIISRSAEKLVELGISRPILVFDRGGYGIHFFKELDEKADFVTWAKYVGDKTLAGIPDESFEVGIWLNNKKYLVAEEKNRNVSESAQTAANEGRSKPTSIDLRMVTIKNVETGKRIAIYTNNTAKPAYDIAYYMLNRWGDSENIFKEMMSRFNLDYHPGYDIKELENQPLVDNPDIAITKKAIRILYKEIEELEKEILLTKAKEDRRPDKRRQEKLSKIGDLITEKKEDIEGFKGKLSQLPEKVSIIEILEGRPMNRCDLEKKKLYDVMQFMAYNSRERLVELFRECYSDNRDVKQVLDMITGRAGYVKLVGQTIIVVLDWIENKKHREAAERFCRLLNKKGIDLTGRLNFKLAFYVSKLPLSATMAPSGAMPNLI